MCDQAAAFLGRLQRATIDDARDRTIHFGLSADGQILSRVINDGSYSTSGGTTNDPVEDHLFVNGVQIADYTSDENNETQNYDYVSLISTKTVPTASGTGKFYRGSSYGLAGAETGTSGYDPVNAITAGTSEASRSAYVVQSGDTLEGIAQQVWGDSSLWYQIADANGLKADSGLVAGRSLAIPLKGPSNSNNASMFRPYDASEAVGDLSPTMAKPPKKGKCGAFGQVLITAIEIAVTVALQSVGVPAPLAAMAGNVVGQGVGLATGIQTGGFSFAQVAIAGIAAEVNVAAGKIMPGSLAGSTFLGDAARGAASSAVTQGIGVATGLQQKFDWVGVAAAGVSSGVMGAVQRGLIGRTNPDTGQPIDANGNVRPATIWNSANAIGNIAARSAAGAIANAATRSVIQGTDFGDNLLAGLPDVIAQTLGGIEANRLKGLGAFDGQDEQSTTGQSDIIVNQERSAALTSGFGADMVNQADETVSDFNDQMDELDAGIRSALAANGGAAQPSASGRGSNGDESNSIGAAAPNFDVFTGQWRDGDTSGTNGNIHILNGIFNILTGHRYQDKITSRSLDATERGLAKTWVGGIDLDEVQLIRGHGNVELAIDAFKNGHPGITLGHRIFLPEGTYDALTRGDGGIDGLNATATLIHELTHVWQIERYGVAYFNARLGADKGVARLTGVSEYHYNRGVDHFVGAGIEQQAQMVEDRYVLTQSRDRTQLMLINKTLQGSMIAGTRR